MIFSKFDYLDFLKRLKLLANKSIARVSSFNFLLRDNFIPRLCDVSDRR